MPIVKFAAHTNDCRPFTEPFASRYNGQVRQMIERVAEFSPLFLWTALIIAGACLERAASPGRAPQARDGSSPNLINGLAVSVAAFFLMPTGAALMAASVQKLGGGWIDLRIPVQNAVLSQGLTLLLFTLAVDLFFYWWHRAEHRLAFLWPIHSVHHSETYLNITTYVRQHFLEMPLQLAFVSFPVAVLFKFSPFNIFLGNLLLAGWGFFGHLNIRLDMGPFSPVFVGPQYHRLHHSLRPEHQNHNFAQYFPVFDILFSTYCPPQKDDYPATGLYSGETMDRPADLILWPFRKYWKDLRGA